MNKQLRLVSSLWANNWYKLALAIVFLVAIAMRIAVPDFDREIRPGDETTYHYGALNLLRHHTLTREVTGEMWRGEAPASPTGALSPGYPFFVAAIYDCFGASSRAILISQALLSIISIWLMYQILCLLKISKSGTIVVLAVAAIYPGFLYNIDRMLTEQLYMALFLSFICLFLKGSERRSHWLLISSGLVLGFAVHVRAQAFPFAILAVAYLGIYGGDRRALWRQIGSFTGAFLVCMAPWWIRNYLTFHEFILLTNASGGAEIWGAVPYFLDMDSTARLTYTQIAHQNFAAAPTAYIRWKLFGFMNYMWADVWDETLVHPGRFLQRAAFFEQMLILVPAIIAVPWIARRKTPSWSFIACIPLLVTLLNLPFHGLPRYAYPAVPYVMLVLGMLMTKQVLAIDTSSVGAQVAAHTWAHRLFFSLSIIFSVWVFYSVYVFSEKISADMSSYRLGKYSKTKIQELTRQRVVSESTYSPGQMVVENSIGRSVPSKFRNRPDSPGIFKLHIGAAATSGNIVTKIVLSVKSGAPYDYTTIYWTTPSAAAISENHVYRVPHFWFQKHQTFYIDGDAENLMIVPSVLLGNRFEFDMARVTKYSVADVQEKS